MDTYTPLIETEAPASARSVLEECVDETWRTVENLPDPTPADYAADIIRRLQFVYFPEEAGR